MESSANPSLTRRELLAGGAGAFLAAYGLAALDASAHSVPRTMQKSLNLPRYNDPAVRAFVKGGGADSLVLWAPAWYLLEPERHKVNEALWNDFEEDLSNAYDDRQPVYISVNSTAPHWAQPPTPPSRHRHRHSPAEAGRLAPTDRTLEGPWADHFSSVMKRTVKYPNIKGILPLNEPNLAFINDHDVPAKSVQLAHTAAAIMDQHQYRGHLLLPATADGYKTLEFTRGVLDELERRPLAKNKRPIDWAHHQYTDVKEGVHHRTAAVLHEVSKYGYALYLSEGGYEFETHPLAHASWAFDYTKPLDDQEAHQAHNLPRHFRWAQLQKGIRMWAQYTWQDSPIGGDGFMSGLVRTDGTPHPVLKKWDEL